MNNISLRGRFESRKHLLLSIFDCILDQSLVIRIDRVVLLRFQVFGELTLIVISLSDSTQLYGFENVCYLSFLVIRCCLNRGSFLVKWCGKNLLNFLLRTFMHGIPINSCFWSLFRYKSLFFCILNRQKLILRKHSFKINFLFLLELFSCIIRSIVRLLFPFITLLSSFLEEFSSFYFNRLSKLNIIY